MATLLGITVGWTCFRYAKKTNVATAVRRTQDFFYISFNLFSQEKAKKKISVGLAWSTVNPMARAVPRGSKLDLRTVICMYVRIVLCMYGPAYMATAKRRFERHVGSGDLRLKTGKTVLPFWDIRGEKK